MQGILWFKMIEWKYVRHPTGDGNGKYKKRENKSTKEMNVMVQTWRFLLLIEWRRKDFPLGGKKKKNCCCCIIKFLTQIKFLLLLWLWCHSYLFMIFNKQFYYSFDDIMHSSHKHLTAYFPYLFPFHRLFSAIYDVIVVFAIMPAFVLVNHSVWRWWCWILIFLESGKYLKV